MEVDAHSSPEQKTREKAEQQRIKAHCSGPLCGDADVKEALQYKASGIPVYSVFVLGYKLSAEFQNRQRHPLFDGTLFGKPIYESPELSNANSGLGGTNLGAILFGSGDGIIIRCGRITFQRILQNSAVDITRGETGYMFRLRIASTYFDASASNANPPLVMMGVP